jgi:hypothetical protein
MRAHERSADLFEHSELLVGPMGHWPSFHDATVKDARREGDVCRVLLHVFEITDTVDSAGYFVLTHHHLVTIRMSGIAECTLPPNYRSDCLFGLEAERVGDFIKVVFDSAIDPEFNWHVVCRTAEIANAVACNSEGETAC